MTTCHYCGTDCSGKFELTVSGSRQAGKTHALLTLAVIEAALDGGQVAYLTGGPGYHTDASFQNCLSYAMRLHPDLIEREYRTNGKQRITFTSGGEIKFLASLDVENEYDLCCYDDWPAERMVKAKRSIRSVLW